MLIYYYSRFVLELPDDSRSAAPFLPRSLCLLLSWAGARAPLNNNNIVMRIGVMKMMESRLLILCANNDIQ